ncbi:hypothetical protein B0T25DRAFT_299642 [Lasiosphaeria hispida]|uniref:Uncharacterized protein n=1 Tax=Lasiosphaeria hispida TaxID=260671 RepID=A0AAJ0H8F3_9PEZI|nr:hypothetical protein B0T25DRAFT_299642 [Lasiosphaeria hispida]
MSQPPGPFHTISSDTWPSIFTKRRGCYPSDDQSYIEYLLDMRALNVDDDSSSSSSGDSDDDGDDVNDNDDGDGNGDNGGDDYSEKGDGQVSQNDNSSFNPNEDLSRVVRPFMKGVSGEEEKRVSLDQTDVVASFCENPAAGDQNKEGDEEPFIGFVDDSCTTDGLVPESPAVEQHRPQQGGLSQGQLHEALTIPRFVNPRNPTPGVNLFDDNVINAEQRKICLPHLGAGGMAVLANTTPGREREAVAAFMYRHLKPTASMGVTFPVKGFQTYALHFHLPYFVLRDPTSGLHRDTRLKPDGKPLRASCVIDCLPTPQCLYEAQMSALVTGIDDFVWTAIGAPETYYDPDSKDVLRKRSKSRHSKQSLEMWDPLVGFGSIPLISPACQVTGMRDPRRYFQAMCEARIPQVLLEWDRIVGVMSASISQRMPPGRPGSGLSKDQVDKLWIEFEERIEDILPLIEKFIACLDKGLRMWKGFTQTDYSYFSDLHSQSEGRGFKEIGKHFHTMQTHRDELEALRTDLLNVKRPAAQRYFELETRRVAVANNAVGVANNAITNMALRLAVVAFLFQPLSQAASMFNMSENVLPFPQTTLWFCLSLIMLTCAYLLVGYTLLYKLEEWVKPTWVRIHKVLTRPVSSNTAKPLPATSAADSPDSRSPELPNVQFWRPELWEGLFRGLNQWITGVSLRRARADGNQDDCLPV